MRRPRLIGSVVVGLALVAALGLPATAWADSVGPTDYRTEIVSVAPDPADAVTFSVEGGDSFLRARVAPGHDLVVYGYDGEPYIRIDADGGVFENRRSESYYYNLERYGGDIPAAADSSATPDWVPVDDDGEHAWHDHRAHWMSRTVLVGMQPGDALPEQIVAVAVDGTPTEITVITTLQRRASALWWLPGIVVGALAVLAALTGRRRGLAVAVGASGAAVLAGVGQTLAVPASTGRPLYWWALPIAAVATAGVGYRVAGEWALLASVWTAVAVELIVWSWPRLAGLLDAYRPTVLPVGLDRILTVAIPLAASGLLLAALRLWIGRPTRPIEPRSPSR